MALRRLALITENPRKAEEWSHHLKPHGVTCDQIAPRGGPLAEQVASLQVQGNYPVVCREQSRLVAPGSCDDVSFQHLALVDHLCTIEVWYSEDGTWKHQNFSARRAGYLDTTAAVEAGGWWDACFRDARTGLSYQEQALQRGLKLSARSAALDQLMDFFAPQHRHAQHLGLSFEPQVVDLQRSVREDVFSNDCFSGLDGFLGELVEAALRQGLFTSLGRTRSQQVYFWPGLSGLPSVPRESEVDEAKFLFHDLVHFLIGRLVPCGEMSEHERRVFVSWAMVEEAVALMLADGYFVDHLVSRGVEYDFDQHKGYPFFRALGLVGEPLEMDKVRRVLWANVAFFVLGDRQDFVKLGLDLEDPQATAYLDGFERFAMGDWLWNERMSLHARANADFYERWWSLAESVNRRAGLGVMTAREAARLVAGDTPRELVRGVFEVIMNHRLLAPLPSLELPEGEKAEWRWLMGQLGFFAAFSELPAIRRGGELLSTTESFAPVKAFLDQSLQVVVEAGFCSAHQATWWKDFFPLFPPYYISYKTRPGLSASGIAERILSDTGGAKHLENDLGSVTAIICDKGRRRFLLERKVDHPLALCNDRYCLVGGYRIRPDEAALVAWRREAGEEWTDPESLAVARRLADLARHWRSFRVQGVEFPGVFDMTVLAIELSESEFDSVTETLVSNNSMANRPEGWPEVLTREQLPRTPLFGGQEIILEQFLQETGATFE
ncbi:MAG: hypothetical protein WC314_16200 [Vulcanimicrobiota bacterium]